MEARFDSWVGRASTIVTGDDDLLSLGEFEGAAIVTPRAFLNSITP